MTKSSGSIDKVSCVFSAGKVRKRFKIDKKTLKPSPHVTLDFGSFSLASPNFVFKLKADKSRISRPTKVHGLKVKLKTPYTYNSMKNKFELSPPRKYSHLVDTIIHVYSVSMFIILEE